MEDKKISEVIDLAIQREEDAITFYRELSNKPFDQITKDTLEWITGEEKKHKAFLVNYREGRQGTDALTMRAAVNYNIAEHLEEPPIETVMDGANIFLLASHRELKSYKFYSELAHLHPEGKLRTTLFKMPVRSWPTRKKWNTYTAIPPFLKLPGVNSSTRLSTTHE
ncbi:MAG: ferritin family protein [Desulfobacterales bacterium]|nr:ferritin family protein [Desulfobacterales bacterium]